MITFCNFKKVVTSKVITFCNFKKVATSKVVTFCNFKKVETSRVATFCYNSFLRWKLLRWKLFAIIPFGGGNFDTKTKN